MGIYKIKGSPYFWFDFSIKGVRFRDSTKTDNRADALAIEAAERRKVVLGEHYKKADKLNLTEAFGKYWMERAQYNQSRDSIKSHIQHILGYFGEQKLLADIGLSDMTAYVAQCRGETYKRKEWKEAKKLTPATINRRISTFQGMHNDARLVWGQQVQNINFKKLKLKEPPPIENILSRELALQWLDTAPTHLRHFTMFAVYAGLRMANILTLKGSQINIEQRYIETIGKGDKLIRVPIVDELLRYIIAHELHKTEYAITFKGKPIGSIRSAWATHCKLIGIKLRRHDLRHTCATWIYEKTGDLLAVKEHLHHADLKTSLRYTHTNKGAQLKKLNKALKTGFKSKPVQILPKRKTANR